MRIRKPRLLTSKIWIGVALDAHPGQSITSRSPCDAGLFTQITIFTNLMNGLAIGMSARVHEQRTAFIVICAGRAVRMTRHRRPACCRVACCRRCLWPRGGGGGANHGDFIGALLSRPNRWPGVGGKRNYAPLPAAFGTVALPRSEAVLPTLLFC